MIFPIRFRAIIIVCTIIIIGMYYLLSINIKDKKVLKHSTGTIVYLNKTFLQYPSSEKELYRYVSIANYPFMFEVYAKEQAKSIDKLQNGEIVTVYYSDINETNNDGINRSLQYIEKDNKIYFKKAGYSIYLIYTVILLTIVCGIGSYALYKNNKIAL